MRSSVKVADVPLPPLAVPQLLRLAVHQLTAAVAVLPSAVSARPVAVHPLLKAAVHRDIVTTAAAVR